MEKIGKLATVAFVSLFVLFGFLGSLTAMTASAHTSGGDLLPRLETEPAVPLRSAAGPDQGHYTFQDDQEVPFGPISGFVDISSYGAQVVLDDERHHDFQAELVDFDFNFYGLNVTTLRVSDNGAIIVNPQTAEDRVSPLNFCLADNPDYYFIAPWWDDWQGADLYFVREGTGADERIIIQWNNVVHFPTPNNSETVAFEVILYERGNLIEFRYGDTSAEPAYDAGAGGTVGIRSSLAASGMLEYSCNSAALTDNRAIRFQRSAITFVKDAIPNSSQVFEFSGSSGISSTFSLQDNGTTANSETFYLVPGNYAVTETVPSNWELTDLTCDSANAITNTAEASVNISLNPEDDITCTFQNSRLGSITINKSADPERDQAFPFTGDLGDFNLYGNGNPLSNTTTFSNLSPATYVVTETEVTGWSLADLSCIGDPDSGSAIDETARQVTIDLDAGENITCTFENVEESKIIVEKVTEPAADPQGFNFTTTIPTTPTFTLTTGAGPVSQSITLSGLSPNSYVITESTATAGNWDLTGLTCTDGIERDPDNRAASVNLVAGQTVTCTFTNTKRAIVAIVKDAVPDHSQLFNFTSSFPVPYPDFPLQDSQESGLPFTNTRLFTVPTGIYTVAEETVANWNLSAITCDDSTGGSSGHPVTRTAVIDVAPADLITCTFTNEAAPGELIVEKVTDPTSDPQVFTYATNITSTPSFTLSTASDPAHQLISQTFTISPGTYAVSEDTLSGWELTGSSCSDGSDIGSIKIDPNETVTCTFTNTKQARILVEKVTIPSNAPDSFNFTLLDGTSPISSFILTAGNVYTSEFLNPGNNYNITETTDPDWDLTSASCDNGDEIAAIDLEAGDTVTCTFTNTKRAQIVVDKVTYPAGYDATFDFSFTTSSDPSPTNFGLTDVARPQVFEALDPSQSYTISETVLDNWSLTDVTCEDGVSSWDSADNINLSPGEVVTCTFTNVANPGTLIVEKVTPQGSYTRPFTFTLSGPEIQEFSLSTGGSDPISRTFEITPGTYSVVEDLPAGWGEPDASCSDNSEVDSVGLEPGETVTCTFTNTRLARLIVDKVTDPPADPTPFEFTLSGGTLFASFPLSDTSPLYDTGFIQPGVFSVTETPEFGWDTSAACTGGHSPDDIDLTLGGVVTCVFTNTVQPGYITVTKQAFPAGSTQFPFAVTRQPGSVLIDEFSLSDDGIWNSPALIYGTYRIDEVATGGYTFLGVECDDPTGDTDDSNDTIGRVDVQLAPGEQITCVFTNTQLANVGSITIIKDAQPNSTQSFTFTGDLGEFYLVDDGATGTYSHTVSFLSPGNYVITESEVFGWNLTDLTCSGDTDNGSAINEAERQVTIDLDGGEDIECSFVNREASDSGPVYLPIILKDFVAQPDLIINSFTVDPPDPDAGQDVVVTIVIENIGTAATDEGFWVDFYIDPATVPDETMGQRRWELLGTTLPVLKGLAWKVSTLLAPGDTVTLTSDGSAGTSPDPADPEVNQRWLSDPSFVTGTNNLYAYVDSYDENLVPEGEIFESNEANNRAEILNLGVTGVALQSDQADPPASVPISSRSDAGR